MNLPRDPEAGGDSAAPTTYVTAQNAAYVTVGGPALQQAEMGSESFGLALLRRLGDGSHDGNMVFSPQTLVDLLAMILPGAQGQTASQLSDALGAAGLDPRTTAAALGKVDAIARADGNKDSNTLQESSDVWTAKGLKLAQGYLSTLAGAFGDGVHQTDFAGDPDGATQAIDDLVSQETHGYINNLFSKGSLDSSTRIVLSDAVYLNAAWAAPFSPGETQDADFHPESGATQQVPTMHQTGDYDYASGDGWQLLELPYAGGKLAMDILLPAKGSGTLATLRDSLSAAQLNSMLTSLTKQEVTLSIPKFTTDYSPEDLKKTITALGLGSLFSDADLAGMTADGEQLSVSQIVEKAHIAVGERGTVAAAAAGGAFASSAVADTKLTFDADHPFLYLVRDVSTGQLLFAGQQTSGS
jgi:serpin B